MTRRDRKVYRVTNPIFLEDKRGFISKESERRDIGEESVYQKAFGEGQSSSQEDRLRQRLPQSRNMPGSSEPEGGTQMPHPDQPGPAVAAEVEEAEDQQVDRDRHRSLNQLTVLIGGQVSSNRLSQFNTNTCINRPPKPPLICADRAEFKSFGKKLPNLSRQRTLMDANRPKAQRREGGS
ncbi:uncharacterized protein ATNIH1004_003985 [Aspergillus tanneri]|uniref:Uncharacterized protein n=1 Tax=Aspergillus tanneri TaxID=1220188 RepID=A0A5M9MM70_9EURO|nr:uncharacterized protein ATNIH1004_003985 [Aspergillus tanneri]KAA8648102.1 hypothetical protein ATNIH1004_003985 [Aspergillus tanneri]